MCGAVKGGLWVGGIRHGEQHFTLALYISTEHIQESNIGSPPRCDRHNNSRAVVMLRHERVKSK